MSDDAMLLPDHSQLYPDTIAAIACRSCREQVGSPCRTPKGRKRFYPHDHRIKDFMRSPGYDGKKYWTHVPVVKIHDEITLLLNRTIPE